MKCLCIHIADIYQKELARGNSLTGVHINRNTIFPIKHTVYFNAPLDEYSIEGKSVKIAVNKFSRFDVPERGYFCLKCGCYVGGPLDAQQKEWYKANELNKFPKTCKDLIATPNNLFWESSAPSELLTPVFQDSIDSDMEFEIHPEDMREYYDMGKDALPSFFMYKQDFQAAADFLLKIFASKKASGIKLMTVTNILQITDFLSLTFAFENGTYQKRFSVSEPLSQIEKAFFISVVNAFESCRYGELYYINVFDSQVLFVTFTGYTVAFTIDGEQPNVSSAFAEVNRDLVVERLCDNWHQMFVFR